MDYPLGRAYVEQVGLLVPGELIDLEVGGVGLEHKRSILVDHADQARAAGPAVQP